MPVAVFYFHSALNDFLPKEKQRLDICVTFKKHETVKHLLESQGVPHTEVDVILVDETAVDFNAQLIDGNRVEIFPVSKIFENAPAVHLQPEALTEPRFVADGHLGKLASYLRLLGFDVLYRGDYDDDSLAEISSTHKRILLTRDRGLLKRNLVQYGYWVRSKSPMDQVLEVLQRYALAEQAQPFSRCARCNGLLVQVEKAEVSDRLEPKTKMYYDDFKVCQNCDQIYWKGSHFKRMESQLHILLKLSKSC
jgi:uncharacterized protein with PIN domain